MVCHAPHGSIGKRKAGTKMATILLLKDVVAARQARMNGYDYEDEDHECGSYCDHDCECDVCYWCECCDRGYYTDCSCNHSYGEWCPEDED